MNGLTLEIVRADEVQVNEHDLFSGVKGSQTALSSSQHCRQSLVKTM
ncbi:hypothetical protein JCM19239_6298 [Vibrio variabilis]|uniref:Uncharacterized protein n=1 Tax=Vibrio variabilis TaxID=990271 RepID=A0ABQ0J9D1_9VIBR|nr:hypothetical protein JCM19239_6298 [Vibrio variabilis]